MRIIGDRQNDGARAARAPRTLGRRHIVSRMLSYNDAISSPLIPMRR